MIDDREITNMCDIYHLYRKASKLWYIAQINYYDMILIKQNVKIKWYYQIRKELLLFIEKNEETTRRQDNK